MSFGVWPHVCPRNHVLDGFQFTPYVREQFWGGKHWPKEQDQQFFCSGIRALEKCYTKCILLARNYVEKWQNMISTSCSTVSFHLSVSFSPHYCQGSTITPPNFRDPKLNILPWHSHNPATFKTAMVNNRLLCDPFIPLLTHAIPEWLNEPLIIRHYTNKASFTFTVSY